MILDRIGTLWSLHDVDLDGFAALGALIEASVFKSLPQAVASLTVFSHPLTVAQTGVQALFPIVRKMGSRGSVELLGDRLVGYDDNTSPTEAFLWANQLKHRPRDLQFNHVYSRSDDPDCYTNLANICVSPSFLAKLTDTDPRVQELLRFRSFDLYGWHPVDEIQPEEPGDYGDLKWVEPLPANDDVRTDLTRQIQKRNNRTTRMVSQTGWLWGAPTVNGKD